MSPRLEIAPELFTELLPGLVHRYIIVAVTSPDLRIRDSRHCGSDRMILAARVNDNDFRRQCLHEKGVAGIEISVVIRLHDSHLAADFGHGGLEITFLGFVQRPIAT